MDELYALRDSAEATKAWRLEAWCKGCEVPPFWCHWWSLRGPWGSFGVLGRTWWVLGGLLGLAGMSLELLGVSGRSLGVPEKSQGLPRGLWKSLKSNDFLLHFHTYSDIRYAKAYLFEELYKLMIITFHHFH